jgi:hypothetical protein
VSTVWARNFSLDNGTTRVNYEAEFSSAPLLLFMDVQTSEGWPGPENVNSGTPPRKPHWVHLVYDLSRTHWAFVIQRWIQCVCGHGVPEIVRWFFSRSDLVNHHFCSKAMVYMFGVVFFTHKQIEAQVDLQWSKAIHVKNFTMKWNYAKS